MKTEEKLIYRLKAQTNPNNELSITATTKEVTHDEAVAIAKGGNIFVNDQPGRYAPFIVEPICTEEEWKEGKVNFCPRCGNRMEHVDGEAYYGDCFDCNATIQVSIEVYDEDEGDEDE